MILRHPELTAYRCFLPDLAGFTGFCCTGPSPVSKVKSRRCAGRKLPSFNFLLLPYLVLAERVGFEPTVPLLGRMLSKHVDSTTLAPLHIDFWKGHLSTWSGERQGDNQRESLCHCPSQVSVLYCEEFTGSHESLLTFCGKEQLSRTIDEIENVRALALLSVLSPRRLSTGPERAHLIRDKRSLIN